MNTLKRHYHWVIAGIIFVEMILYGGFLNAASVFTVPITEDLLLTRGDYALVQIPKGVVGFFSTLVTGFLLHRFGYRAFGSITGVFLAMVSLGSMVAGPIVNLFYDRLGSYAPVFRVAALIDIALIGLYLLLFYLCEKEKRNFIATKGLP